MGCKASVIIPVYRAEKTLRRCVESLVFGRERNIEVILVDDCSGDRSWDVCRELVAEFPNVQCVQNPENRGVSYTRNHGLAHAHGEYILFVDSDDWVSGRYVQVLVDTAEQYRQCLVMCSMRFINRVDNYRQDFYWDGNRERVNLVGGERFFELAGSFFLQSPCNKAFRRDVVASENLRFDETQSMGEDFQFVLDYIEAAGTKQCVVVNDPLYYYIRWNNSSLMSHFGPDTRRQAQERFFKLYQLCAEADGALEKYHHALAGLDQNYVYHIARSGKLSTRDKLQRIGELVGRDRVQKVYTQQMTIRAKENLAAALGAVRHLPDRIRGRVSRKSLERKIAGLREQLHNRTVTIISQNCIGGVFYHDMQLQFASPTVNLFLNAPNFVKFSSDLRRYLQCEMQMRWEEEYPIGILDDIEIHFMHYETCREARLAWERRKQRIHYENILIVSTDRNSFDDDVFEAWQRIPYPKVLFTSNPEYGKAEDSVFFPEYRDQVCVPDLISRREFYRDNMLMDAVNRVGGC